MNKKYANRIWIVITAFAPIILACGLVTGAVPAATSTQASFVLPTGIPPRTVVPSPTSSSEPTIESAPIPSPTLAIVPTIVQTEITNPLMADIKDYYGKGYLPFETGQLYNLDDFSETKPSVKIFDFTRTGQQSQDFALWADIELDTTGSTTYPKYTGCGFAYRVQNNNEGYTAILTNDVVRVSHCTNGLSQCELFGTTHGTGNVDVRDRTKVRFSLAVNRDRAYVLVDGVMVGQYTLFTTKLLGMGDLYYGVVSDINDEYWTSCKITNAQLWESTP